MNGEMIFRVDMIPYIKGLSGKLRYELDKFGTDILKDVSTRTQISVKLRAPKDTGKLRQSISLEIPSKNMMQIVIGRGLTRAYAIYQEYGYVGHWVSKTKNPDVMIGKSPHRVWVKEKPINMEGYYVGPTMRMIPEFIERAADTHWKRRKRRKGRI